MQRISKVGGLEEAVQVRAFEAGPWGRGMVVSWGLDDDRKWRGGDGFTFYV